MARIVKKRHSKAEPPVDVGHQLDPYVKGEEVTIVEVPRPNTTPIPRKLTPPPMRRSPTPPPLPISQMSSAPYVPHHTIQGLGKYDNETDIETSPENIKVVVYQKIFVIIDSMHDNDKLSALALIEAFSQMSPRERSAITLIVEKLAGSH